MNSQVITSYSTSLVGLSLFLSFVGSFVALSVTARILATKTPSFLNIAAAGLALGGVGVWAMHFIGMLALNMDVGTSYSPTETVGSLLLAVVSVSIALNQLVKNSRSLSRLVTAGTVVGLSVAGMHYLGMYGMKFNGYISWDFITVAASVLIAIVAATAALWLAFNTANLGARAVAASIMGVAVSAMHYTGMSAANFVCTTTNRNAIPSGDGFIPSFQLPTLVTTVSVTLVVLIVMDQILQAYLTTKPATKSGMQR